MSLIFDLQSHSDHSDGALAPAEVVARAAQAGVQLLALTDHDSVGGVAEAINAGARHGVRVVAAAELSAVDGEHEDLHVLGYCIDHTDAGLLDALAGFREDRARRADRMSEALQELGFALEDGPLRSRRADGRPVGRPHLAQAVFDHSANALRLHAEGLAGDPSDVLVAYLTPGAPAYRARNTPTVSEAIDVIHAAGGVAVWAHPFWDLDEPAAVVATIERFAAEGLDGVEAFYVTHDRDQTLLLARECERRGLLTTGSADFHGPDHQRFDRFAAFELHGMQPRLGPIAD